MRAGGNKKSNTADFAGLSALTFTRVFQPVRQRCIR